MKPRQRVHQGDDLAPLSDDFLGAAISSAWVNYEGDGTSSIAVSGGELNLTCNQGGAADSFWFNGEQGILLHKVVTGNFDVVADVRVRNLADSGLPTVGDGNFRIAGLAAHDPNRATNLNYVHVGLGCTASAAITCEWKTTVNNVSTFGSVAAPSGTGQLRLVRQGQVFTAYYRALTTDPWTTVQVMDRTANPLPSALQVGLMVYASVAGHDERIFVNRITFRRP